MVTVNSLATGVAASHSLLSPAWVAVMVAVPALMAWNAVPLLMI